MAITADKVVTILEAKTEAFDAKIANSAKQFEAKIAQISAAAERAGKATSLIGVHPAFEKFGKQLGQGADGLQRIGTEGRMAQQQMRNLAFQFQDIGTMLAAGQSPFMLLAQQLPQVTMYGGSLNGVMGALRGTIAGLLSPLGLATTAFVLLGSAAVSWATSASDDTDAVSKSLEETRKRLEEIIAGYDRAAEAANRYREQAGARSPEEAQGDLRRERSGLVEQYDAQVASLRDTIRDLREYVLAYARGTEFEDRAVKQAEALAAIQRAADEATPDLDAIIVSLKDFIENDPYDVLEGVAQGMLDSAMAARQFQTEIGALDAGREHITAMEEATRDLSAEISKVTSEKAQKEVSDLAQKAIEGEISIDDFKAAVAALSTTAPDLSGHISEFERLIGVIRQARAEAEGFTGRESQGGRTRYGSTGYMTLPGTAPLPERRVDPYFDDPNSKTRGGGRKREDEYARLTRQIEQRTKALEAETAAQAGLNPLLDDYGYAAERAKLEAQLLVAAEQAKIEITPGVRQAIEATAEGYALATAAARELAEEQREALRSAEEWLNVGQDVTKGFIDDLINGKSAAESFASAISKIGDALIDDVLSAIFDIKNASGGGILSFLGGLLGLGGGGGFSLPGSAPIPTPNPLGSVADTLRAPVQVPSMPSMARSASASRAPQDVHIAVDVSGARGNAEIMEMVGQGVREGLRQYDREAGPSMVKRVVNDPRAVG